MYVCDLTCRFNMSFVSDAEEDLRIIGTNWYLMTHIHYKALIDCKLTVKALDGIISNRLHIKLYKKDDW